MARPAKPLSEQSGAITKEESAEREKTEARLRGQNDTIKPSEYLNEAQENIFDYIVKNLEKAGVLGNLDLFVLEMAAISICRIREIEIAINEDPEELSNSKLMAAKEKYSKDFFRCCNELALSPQARAKIAIASVKAVKENRNPILDVLEEDE